MKRLLALVLILTLPVLLVADGKKADEKKPDKKANTLTPQEVRDGWLLLFDGETTFGWITEGTVRTVDGSLMLCGEGETSVRTVCEFGSDFEVKFEFRNDSQEANVMAGVTHNGRWRHQASLVRAEGEWAQGSIMLSYDREKRKHFSTVTSRAKASGGRGKSGPGPAERSNRGIGFVAPGGSTLELRRIRLKPVGLKSIFDGKDLDGWKVFEGKGKKSKYTVTKEGRLNVMDGPGDLQTTKTFDDFVLQLECISNGDRLNSGVFFRCIPGEYQNGYEAQVHNGWTDTPKKTYTIDEYDPKTHKLLAKKRIPSKAMDYGTGAIYRRMPARFGVAKDREWFTMTVVARERHIATWVNGIQVVDWTDNRPDNDNPRNGYRSAAGAISIQGHDPTTDLSFRNIRIAQLPRGKK